MKRLLIMAALLLLATSAFAQTPGRFPGSIGAGTILNADSCDIGVNPAATLLLPYFEVDFNSNSTEAVNTVFTITNTSNLPQIAHVTVWTDWSVPVLDFNVFLTGYDVQGISLYDVIARGVLPVTGVTVSPRPQAPNTGIVALNTGNPAHTDLSRCTPSAVPPGGQIPSALVTQVQRALTGLSFQFGGVGGCPVGNIHANAVGYVTVDVARTCSILLPTATEYYTNDIAFDNVLIGDFQRINPTVTTGNFAAGNPMVHIRALPEGTLRTGVTTADVTFPYTFYRRYTPNANPKIDRRAPLPGVWAARYIEEQDGIQDFETEYLIWREGVTVGLPACGTGANAAVQNRNIPLTEIVRFDESENPSTLAGEICRISPCPDIGFVSFPETGRFNTTDTEHFPGDFGGTDDLGGWTFMNLNHGALEARQAVRPGETGTGSQNWVVVQMTAEGRYGVNFDAAWLANGCTDNPGLSHVSQTGSPYTLGPVVDSPGITPNPNPGS